MRHIVIPAFDVERYNAPAVLDNTTRFGMNGPEIPVARGSHYPSAGVRPLVANR